LRATLATHHDGVSNRVVAWHEKDYTQLANVDAPLVIVSAADHLKGWAGEIMTLKGSIDELESAVVAKLAP